MGIGIGRIVHYRLGVADATQINRRRGDARFARSAENRDGSQIHFGYDVSAGMIFPMIVTKIDVPDEGAITINGQVLLDGNDSLWVRNVSETEFESDDPGWMWPSRK